MAPLPSFSGWQPRAARLQGPELASRNLDPKSPNITSCLFCAWLSPVRSVLQRTVWLMACVTLGSCAGQEARLGVSRPEGVKVCISISAEGALPAARITLFRSTSRLQPPHPDTGASPVTVYEFAGNDSAASLVDSMLAHNVTYYYIARLTLGENKELWTNLDSAIVPDVETGTIFGSSILIDKPHYFLEIRDGGKMKKRYPIALGKDPRGRKLYQDRSTTPEGIYRVTNVQPHATYYKALDLDYPNEIDRQRYEYCKAAGLIKRDERDYPGPGGEIQIHGRGIERNWTNGCIALRNQDMDELLAHPRIGRNVPVVIVGSELTREDIFSIEDYRTGREIRAIQNKLKQLGYYSKRPDGTLGKETRLALARLQQANNLPITCDLDRRTVSLLSREP